LLIYHLQGMIGRQPAPSPLGAGAGEVDEGGGGGEGEGDGKVQLDDYTAKFVYTGQENVPVNVNHVQVHPSIKVIHARAFL
jgi:hypothetical protein